HDSVIGVTIDNLPSDEYIDAESIGNFLKRLYPKLLNEKERRKIPVPRIMSGIKNGRTTGTPLCAIIQNPDVQTTEKTYVSSPERIGSSDYAGTSHCKGFGDIKRLASYSGHFIVPLCFAGALCAQILERRGIYTGAHIASVHNIKDNPFDPVCISRDDILSIRLKDFPVINDYKGWMMLDDIAKAHEADESLGGVIECASVNVPAGVGEPVFTGLKNSIAQLVFGIPAISGIEFGSGFSAAEMIGSQYSDYFYTDERGCTHSGTNSHGGILGGVSTGMPVIINAAVQPLNNNYTGLHKKTCFVPEASVCVEAAVNIALLSNMIDYPNFCLR
ncbi:MAG: chorismate synthase, partial [Ruminococcus sp.]|nr:chorismate synthase [Ruminococcus sp.]